MNRTLPSGAVCVWNADKRYLQSRMKERATSLQYRWNELNEASFAAREAPNPLCVLTAASSRVGAAFSLRGSAPAGLGANTCTLGLGRGSKVRFGSVTELGASGFKETVSGTRAAPGS